MNPEDLYKLLSTVQKNMRCPQCGKQYDLARIHIRGVMDSVIFLELDCKNHMPVLATVAINPKKEQEKSFEKVNPNDVVETYHFLKNFSGDFEKIFNKDK